MSEERLKGSWAIVLVRKYMPLECTPELLKTSKIYFGKNGYTFNRQLICDDHEWFHRNCGNCTTETEIYTDENCFQHAIDMAQMKCSLYDDAWVVDTETLQIVAAFRMNIEKLV